MLHNTKKVRSVTIALLLLLILLPIQTMAAASGTHTPVEGVNVSVSGATDNSMTNGAVTVTAKGNAGTFGFGASAKTATITVFNNSGSKATVSFDWTATSVNQLVIDGTTYTGTSASFSKLLDNGESVTVTVTTAKNGTTNKLVMSNFAIVAAGDSSSITVNYDSSLGSVTIDGSAVDSGEGVEITEIEKEIPLVATVKADSGAVFVGWFEEDNKFISSETTYKNTFASPKTLRAVFATKAMFLVNNYLYNDLNNAATEASNSTKLIILANTGILPDGDYTIPAGVTLLIPFDANNTVYTTSPAYVDAYTQPTAYRTLTMAEGANLTIEGSMSISANHKVAQGSSPAGGVPVGNIGFVQMNDGSSITVKSGGVLYAWGYITGDGTVTAKSGSSIYENFQVMDFRGGTQSTGMKNKVFLLSQYYIQNIEVPLTLEAGAKEYAFTSMSMSLATISKSITFIGPDGSDALFILSKGSITKRYDGSTDRLIIEVDGDMSVSKIEITYGLFSTITTEGKVLDLNGNISVILNSGTTTISQDMAMQPGAHITIDEDASLVVPSGYNLYVYDSEQWGTYVHSGNTNDTTIRPLIYAPSRTHTRSISIADFADASIMVKGTLDASLGSIYTTDSGALIEGTEGGQVITTAGTQAATYQISDQKSSASDTVYATIGITPAKLLNGDKTTYVSTADATTETTYTYVNNVWCKNHRIVETVTTPATCISDGVLTKACSGGCGTSTTEEIPATSTHTDTQTDSTQDGFLKCDGCGAKLFKLVSMNAAADARTELILKFEVNSTLASEGNVSVSFGGSASKEAEIEIDAATNTVTVIQPVASGQMTEDVTVTFSNSTESAYVVNTGETSVSRSVVDYARAVLQMEYPADETSQEYKDLRAQKKLVAALVNYGGYAQIYFDKNPDDIAPLTDVILASDVLKDEGIFLLDEDRPDITKVDDSFGDPDIYSELPGGINKVTQNAVLKAAIYQDVFFYLDSDNIDSYTFNLKYTVGDKEIEIDLTPVEAPDSENPDVYRYKVTILNIPAAYLDYAYTITINDTHTVTPSIISYLQRLLNISNDQDQKNLAKAIYLYNQAANEFFGK